MTDYSVLQPIHLGSGQLGGARKKALEQLAAEADCFWGGNPSIGRWLIQMADYKIQEMEDSRMTMKDILQSIYDNGRVTSESPQEVLENEFDFEAREQGWKDEEIEKAISSDWFPSQPRT